MSKTRARTALYLAMCTACLPVKLSAQDSIEEIEVVGSRSSLASALNKQREADQVVGVVDSDALGNFADINVAESLRRISGIMVENDQGEGRYVSVRGLNADLNAMTINGVSTATPEDRRGIMLDGVPTDLLESMTVYKSLTPNLDADTIGGAIDLETLSAFSRDGRFVRLKAETSHNELSRDSSNPKLSATFSDRWNVPGGELGIAAVLSDQTRRIISHNNENGGWSDVVPNDDYELRFYDLERERQGLVFNVDYLTDAGNTFYAHLFHNRYTEQEWRAKFETRKVLEDDPTDITGNTFTYNESRVDTESKNRIEGREITSYQIGAELQLNQRNRIELELFGSDAKQDDTDGYNAIFRSKKLNLPILYDNTNPQRPIVTFPADFYDPASFELKTWESEMAMNTDEDIGGRIDVFTSFNRTTEIQYGAKYRQREKRNDFNLCGYDPVDDLSLSDFGFDTIPPYLNTIHGPAPSFEQVKASKGLLGEGNIALSDGTFCANPGTFFELSGDEDEESIAADWSTDEDVLAVYAMATTVLENSTWVYGLRYEDTDTAYRGKNYDGIGFAGNTAFENNYSFLAPSLNVKFAIADNQIIRGGAFRSLVRPGFKQSRAGAEIDLDDIEIKGGNPNLDPTTAWNFDITYELYLGDETFVGAGVFYKELSDSIVEVESTDALLRGQVWNVAKTFINAGDSDIVGFELSFQTAFDSGFLFQANYTNSDGESQLPLDARNGARVIPFFKQAEHSANIALGYDKGRWDIRLAGNYRSSYLDEVGDKPLVDRYTDDHQQIDLTARFDVSDELVISAEAINLNNEPEYYYYGNTSRLAQYDEFGTTYALGLRYSF